MAWIVLVFAGFCEATWAVMLRQTMGWTRLVPSAVTVGFMLLSFYCLSLALRKIPVGTAYAVWTGIGAAGTAAVGAMLFGEPVTPLRVAGILLILGGVATLRLAA